MLFVTLVEGPVLSGGLHAAPACVLCVVTCPVLIVWHSCVLPLGLAPFTSHNLGTRRAALRTDTGMGTAERCKEGYEGFPWGCPSEPFRGHLVDHGVALVSCGGVLVSRQEWGEL